MHSTLKPAFPRARRDPLLRSSPGRPSAAGDSGLVPKVGEGGRMGRMPPRGTLLGPHSGTAAGRCGRDANPPVPLAFPLSKNNPYLQLYIFQRRGGGRTLALKLLSRSPGPSVLTPVTPRGSSGRSYLTQVHLPVGGAPRIPAALRRKRDSLDPGASSPPRRTAPRAAPAQTSQFPGCGDRTG